MVRVNDGTAISLVLNADFIATENTEAAQLVVRLYSQHAASLHRYLLLSGSQPADADELLQEAFLRLFRALKAGEVVETHKAWLIRVLQNLRTDRARRESLYTSTPTEDLPQTTPLWSSSVPTPEQSLIDNERFSRLETAMQSLSERQHKYLLLRAEGHTLREIAEVHGVSIQSVAETCARAIERLGKLTNG